MLIVYENFENIKNVCLRKSRNRQYKRMNNEIQNTKQNAKY